MPYRLEVPQSYTTWGAGGKFWKAGIYVIPDDVGSRIREAVVRYSKIRLTQITDEEAAAEPAAAVAPDPALTGALTLEDLEKGNVPEFTCQFVAEGEADVCGGGPYKSDVGLNTHMTRIHKITLEKFNAPAEAEPEGDDAEPEAIVIPPDDQEPFETSNEPEEAPAAEE